MRKCDHRELLGHLSAPPERGRRRAPQVLDVERRASSRGQPTRRGSARPPRVDTCKVTPRIDDVPVWVVPCLYVRRSHRDRGVTTALLRAAVDYAAKRGAPAVEGYPRSDDAPRVASESAWFGTEAQFRRAGYRKVRGVRPDLPRGWAPRVTMRAKIGATKR